MPSGSALSGDEPDSVIRHDQTVVRRNIALVAHDHRKADLLEWVQYNKGSLIGHNIVATGTTGKLVAASGIEVTCLLSGPLGGDQQLGAMIAQGEIDLLVFFWDPLEPQPHDPDVKALLRVAVMWNVVVACNRATADYLISSPLFASSYTGQPPSFAAHSERTLPGVKTGPAKPARPATPAKPPRPRQRRSADQRKPAGPT